MADAPELDGRRAEAIRRNVEALAPYYTDDWRPDAGGVGAGLVDVFSELGAEVTERLDATPEKHRVAFFDALGFSARPPQAARVPVQYTLAPEAPRNVAVRPGTAAVAAAGEEVAFHVGEADAFEATAARLADVVAVDPDEDAVFDHGAVIDGGESVDLWDGTDEQVHDWFLGDAELLSAGAGDTVVIEVETAADPAVLVEATEWRYFGARGEDEPEDWWPVRDVSVVRDRRGGPALHLTPDGPLVEHAVDGVESRWLRCRLLDGLDPTGERSFEVRSVDVAVNNGATPGYPDQLLANDVPQENPAKAEPIRPFGDRPQPGDAFYLRADTALSTPDAEVTLEFSAHESMGGARTVSTDGGTVAATASSGAGSRVHAASADPDGNDSGESDTQAVYTATYEHEPTTVTAGTTTGTTGIVDVTEADPPDGAGTDDPALSWEYWDGGGWSRLGLTDDTTEALGATGTSRVVFPVPDDLEPTTVSGHEGHWIRVRLVGGGYGRAVVAERTDDTQWVRTVEGSPPAYREITVAYRVDRARPPAHVRTHNGLAATGHAVGESFRPFTPPPESEQTLYLGFDGPLSGGPLQLFAAVDEHAYPEGFTPRLRWERRRAADPGWTRLDVTDDTAGLTEQGIVGMAFPEPTRATERFGRERHWVRARVTGDEFELEGSPTAPERAGGGRQGGRSAAALRRDLLTAGATLESFAGRTFSFERMADGGSRAIEPCGATVETAPPGGEPTAAPPTISGLHFNTGWARNVRVVEDELLGGSDGEREQTFPLSASPAVDAEVWVDEQTALSAPQRERLAAERPADVEVERTAGGEVRAVWVRWRAVPDLLDSGSDARHFVLDPIEGEVRFGDGQRGRIPPRGANNVRASYRTGGGAAGNVPAGAVAELKSGLPFVDSVANPVPGAGGADRESTDEVLTRAPRTLRDRGRAVMPADYERLAEDASRRVARAECLPAMDAGGEHDPGFVTVLVVPNERTETPVPSIGLLDRVEAELADRAPASVVAGDRLVVRGPSYVSVGIEADVVAGDVGSLNAVEERLLDAVEGFLHPLAGRDGDGWPFGELPTRSDVFALLEGVEGVDHVASLFLTFVGTETITVGEGGPRPTASADALVRGGEHDLTVSLGGSD